MKRISLRTWLAGAVLGVALAMTLFAASVTRTAQLRLGRR